MKKIILAIVITIIVLVILSFAFDWLNVFRTQTIGKAQQNAEREVFEQTQSYVEGKRQAALKYFKEYSLANDSTKKNLKYIIALEFANFDEKQYLTGELYDFIYKCKYK